MLVMLLGRVMESSATQSLKASSPMLVTLLGTTVLETPLMRVLVSVWMIALQLLRES